MKRHAVLFLFFLSTIFVWGKEVTLQQVKDMAIGYISNRSHAVSVKDTHRMGKEKAYYIVNLNPQGWVIISGDDVVEPIIGYSFKGSLYAEDIPENMKYMLDCCEKVMKQTANITQSVHPYWLNIGYVQTKAAKTVIEPLIKVNWNQSAPYNAYCPGEGSEQAIVGCVAVAMSQAMSVHRYPSRPKGKVSYTAPGYGGLSIDFDAERAYNWDEIIQGSNNYDETARLLYHAGMSVEMKYGVSASGILTNEVSKISNALRDNFSYPEDVTYIWREQYNGDWEQLLINELNAGRAIVYNAVDSKNGGGHSFNLDGYDGEGHFHVNWGWGGYGNAYFSIDNLRDAAMQMDYDQMHVAVLGIGAADQILKSISLSNNRIEEGLPAGSVVGQVFVNGEIPQPSFSLSVSGVNGKELPFTIEDGMLKTTQLLQTATATEWEIEITVNDSESGTSLTQGFKVTVEAWKSLEETTSIRFDRAAGKFLLKTKHNVSYTLADEQGNVLSQNKLEPLPQLEIFVSALHEGVNVLTLECVNETKTIRLIK